MKKIIIFLPSNYPNKLFFSFFINKIVKFGIDYIEIGIPYIDSISDGNLIYHSNKKNIKNWNLNNIFKNIYNFKIYNTITKIIIMGNYNPIVKYNEKKITLILNKIKLDSLLIIDYNLDCNNKLFFLLKKYNLNFIKFYSKNISRNKIFYLNKYKSNINYFTYIKGITGDKKIFNISLINKYFKKHFKKNIFLGFGISNLIDILKLNKITNLVIGSYLIYLINKYYYNYTKIFKIIKLISFLTKKI